MQRGRALATAAAALRRAGFRPDLVFAHIGWGEALFLKDIFPAAPPAGLLPTCAEAGILGALTGVIGSLQALEVLKLVGGIGEPLIGRLLLYDGLAQRFEEIRYRRKAR